MVRQILKADSNTVAITVPEDYVGKILEVIAFSQEEGFTNQGSRKRQPTFSAVSIDTEALKFNRDQANER